MLVFAYEHCDDEDWTPLCYYTDILAAAYSSEAAVIPKHAIQTQDTRQKRWQSIHSDRLAESAAVDQEGEDGPDDEDCIRGGVHRPVAACRRHSSLLGVLA